MTRKKRLLWLFRSMAIPMVMGIALVYSGIQLSVTPAIIVGVVLFVLGSVGAVGINIISKRPPVKLVKRWKEYLALKTDDITDYAAELGRIEQNFRADTSKDKNIFDMPMISDIKSFCDFSALSGKLYYGCMVRANELLFMPSPNTDEAFPAMFLYSRDEHYKQNPQKLLHIADALYKDKEHNFLRYETLYHFNEPLDSELTGGREVFVTDILICRALVPMGMLGGLRILPIVADPEKSKSAFVVDCKYWTDKYIHAYITTGEEYDGPPDTYGNPFPETNNDQ